MQHTVLHIPNHIFNAGTRGANRGEKNEIRSALRTQVRRAYDNLDDVIMDFVNNNRDSLFQIML